MKKIYLFFFFGFMALQIAAQTNTNNVLSAQTDLTRVNSGDIITIQPDVTFGPKNHYLLKGILKTVGVGTLTYQINRTINNSAGKTAGHNLTTNKNLIPSIGMGLAIGAPDLLKALRKVDRPIVKYILYRNDFTVADVVTFNVIRKRNNLIFFTVKAKTNGYVKASISIKNKTTEVPVSVTSSTLMGTMAVKMNTQSSGECLSTFDPGDTDFGAGIADDKCHCRAYFILKCAGALGLAESAAAGCTVLGPAAPFCIAGVTLTYLAALGVARLEYDDCIAGCK